MKTALGNTVERALMPVQHCGDIHAWRVRIRVKANGKTRYVGTFGPYRKSSREEVLRLATSQAESRILAAESRLLSRRYSRPCGRKPPSCSKG